MKLLLTTMMGMTIAASAFSSQLSINYKFDDADTGSKVKGSGEVSIPSLVSKNERFFEVPEMRKTMTVLYLTNALEEAISSYGDTCN